MADKTMVFPANSALILNPTTYRTGGTNVGLIGTAHVAGFSYQTNLRSKVSTGGQFVGADITAMNLIYNIIILDRSETLMGLLFQESDSVFEFFQSYKLGHPIEYTNPTMFKKLLVRPTDAEKPHLYIPKAFVFDVGPFVWDRRQNHYDSTIISVAAMWDYDRNCAFHYGFEEDLALVTPAE